MVYRIYKKECRDPKTDIVIHSWPCSGQQKPLVKIQSAQVVKIRSAATDKTKTLSLGSLGTITIPLASSNINESDTIVRVQDGTVAAIGGLMKQQQLNSNSGLPGTSDLGVLSNIFGSRSRQLTKSELVILLKTTVIKGDTAWQQQGQEVSERIQNLRRPEPSADKQKGK